MSHCSVLKVQMKISLSTVRFVLDLNHAVGLGEGRRGNNPPSKAHCERSERNMYSAEYICALVGFYCGEGPPVPFPNTEVKLTCADNTRLETAREDMTKPTQMKTLLSADKGVFACPGSAVGTRGARPLQRKDKHPSPYGRHPLYKR